MTTNVLPETPARPARQPGVDDSRGQSRGADGFGDTEDFPIQDVDGGLRRDVARRDSGAAHRDHQVHPTDHRGVQRVADLHLVSRDRHHTVDDEPRLGQQLGDQRPAVVLVAVRGAIVDHDDQSPADH